MRRVGVGVGVWVGVEWGATGARAGRRASAQDTQSVREGYARWTWWLLFWAADDGEGEMSGEARCSGVELGWDRLAGRR
jgi:hypothetical protein